MYADWSYSSQDIFGQVVISVVDRFALSASVRTLHLITQSLQVITGSLMISIGLLFQSNPPSASKGGKRTSPARSRQLARGSAT